MITELQPTTGRRIMSRALWQVFAADFGTLTSFYLLISVVPMYASSAGVSDIGAGMTTAALMLATVIAELLTPRLVARFGYRTTFAAGLVLLGAPALVLAVTSDVAAIVAVCLVRGVGFAITMVVGGALVAALLPPERRGEGLGLHGIVVGVPGVIALPAGIWLVGSAGYPVVFVIGALAALLPLAALIGLPEPGVDVTDDSVGMSEGLRCTALVRPAIVFSATAMAGGVAVTFLPLAVTGWSGNLAATALLVQLLTATIARWWAGRFGDRHGPARLLLPGLLIAGVGLLPLVLSDEPVAVLAGMALFGVGFGITQNVTMALMFNRVPASGYGTASALWNVGYDLGYGVGAAAFGLVAGETGYGIAWALTAALVLVMLVPARRDGRAV